MISTRGLKAGESFLREHNRKYRGSIKTFASMQVVDEFDVAIRPLAFVLSD